MPRVRRESEGRPGGRYAATARRLLGEDGAHRERLARFRDVAATLRTAGDKREQVANDRASALEKRLIKVRIDVPQAARVPSLTVYRDGAVVPDGAWGIATAVDPGSVLIEAKAPGRVPFRRSVEAGKEGEVVVVEVPMLEAEAAPATPPPPASPPVAAREDGAGRRTIALVSGVVGLVAVVVGSVFGLRASSKWTEAKNHHCDAALNCDAQGGKLATDAKSAGNVSTMAFVAGGIGFAAGATLWLTAPSSREQVGLAPSVSPHGATLSLRGAF